MNAAARDSDSSQDVIYTPAESTPPLRHSPTGENPIETSGYLQRQRDAARHPALKQVDQSHRGRYKPVLDPTSMSYEADERKTHVRSRSNGSLTGDRRQPELRGGLSTRSPGYGPAENQVRKRYTLAAICLIISLISFVVQTETAVYIQKTIKWDKAYCMLWLTHGSWIVLWPTQLLILRLTEIRRPWKSFWREHSSELRETAQMVRYQVLHPQSSESPWRHMIKITAGVTTFLTFAGASWYVAIGLTTPSDLTAIYNCSAFFAYVFSILLLNDKFRWDKVIAVGLAILGVLVVAYGDSGNPTSGSHSGGATDPNHDQKPDNRLLGNLIIGIGSVMYGLYEVLYKKYACPPDGTPPAAGMHFATTFGSMVGTFTLSVLWIPLPILHLTGLERFALPSGRGALLLAISTLSNATFSGAFLVLMSLTSPVLSSVAALLTIFLVAITHWFLTGEPISVATTMGGVLIIIAFLLLSWATWKEMSEQETRRAKTLHEDMDEAEGMLEDHQDGFR